MLRRGNWYSNDNLVVDGMTLGDLRVVPKAHYSPEDDVANRLVLKYRSGTRGDPRYYEDEDGVIPNSRELRTKKYELAVRMNRGDEREEDCSSDSKFKSNIMPDVGAAIREKFEHVPRDKPIFLFLDNAGGHGTDECVRQYVEMLKNEHNVICIH